MIGRWTRVRIGLCGLVMVLLSAGVLRRAIQLQVREAPQLKEWAERNYLRDIELAPRRGRILDRNGDELASTVDFDSVFCNPRQLAAVPDAAGKLARALRMDVREVQRILAQPRYFAWLRRKLNPTESAAALALRLPGVGVRKEPGRVYPKGDLAATVLGYTSVDGRGVEGLELGFDTTLRGSGVEVPSIRDSYGHALLVEGAVDTSAAAGKDVMVAMDKYLAYVTQTALADGVKKFNARAGVAVVMDPRNGDVLAMANVPSYDPNDPRDANAREARDRAVTDAFEPGSVMKTFTFAAALDARKLRPEDQFDCQMGLIVVGKHPIHDDRPFGVLTAAEVFKHSSNIGAIKIARRIGRETLHDALSRFGFGRRPGVGLPGESAGILRPLSRWGEIELATAAFGHGLTVTPLQLVAGFAAVASGGVYHPPRLVLKTVSPDGQEEAVPPAREPARVMGEPAARTLLKIMLGVTESDGTGKLAAIDGYPVAGKTGTAIKVVNGHYDAQKNVATFVGIVPANDPRLVIGVTLDEPQPHHHGGEVAAPVFKEIAEAALRYLGIPPSLPLLAKASREPAARRPPPAADEDLGDGGSVDVLPPVADDGDQEGEGALASTGSDADLVTVPSFAGMSLGEVIRAARRAGVEVVPEGSGVAVAQAPGPGAQPRGSVCRVAFRPGG